MLKLIMCVRRLPDLTPESFDDHWRNRHAPLIRKHAATLGIRKYVQNTPLSDPAGQVESQQARGSDAADFDGYAELWWDSLEAQLASRSTEAGQQALQEIIEDERRFLDLSRSQIWYGQERVILS